jgi:hypothetical protein
LRSWINTLALVDVLIIMLAMPKQRGEYKGVVESEDENYGCFFLLFFFFFFFFFFFLLMETFFALIIFSVSACTASFYFQNDSILLIN